MAVKKKRLGEMLIEDGLITEAQLEEALVQQKGKNRKIGRVLIELGYVNEIQVAETLTRQLSLPLLDCNRYMPGKELLSIVSKETAERKIVIPLELKGRNLLLAMANPLDWETVISRCQEPQPFPAPFQPSFPPCGFLHIHLPLPRINGKQLRPELY